MYQGATLTAAIVHLLAADRKPQMADMMAAYVECSRVKTKETLLVAEPFSPALFCLGPPPGPKILLQLLRGEIAPEAVEAEFDRLETLQRATGGETDLMKQKWPCMSCELAGREDSMKPIGDGFGVRNASDFREKLLPQGAWARCTRCSRASSGAAGGAANTEAQQEQRRQRFSQSRNDQRRLAASTATATCTQCGKEGPRTEFWPADWHNRDQGVKCTECEPRQPAERASVRGQLSDGCRQRIEERRLTLLACRTCTLEKPPDCFWPMDITNRKQNGGLSCTLCEPTPPSERCRIYMFTCRTCGAEKPNDQFWPRDIKNRRQNGGLSCTTCEPTASEGRRSKRKQSIGSTNH